MARRLSKAGHSCVVYDRSTDAVKQLADEGALGASSLEKFASKLKSRRTAWPIDPSAAVDATLEGLAPHRQTDDVIIDGGNSYHVDDLRRQDELRPRGIHYGGRRHERLRSFRGRRRSRNPRDSSSQTGWANSTRPGSPSWRRSSMTPPA
jgi:hypothetical protein